MSVLTRAREFASYLALNKPTSLRMGIM